MHRQFSWQVGNEKGGSFSYMFDQVDNKIARFDNSDFFDRLGGWPVTSSGQSQMDMFVFT